MSSISEKGHAKNVANFETMITVCRGFNANYNPSNPSLLLEQLVSMHLLAKADVKNVKITESPFNDVEGQRRLLFKPLKPLATKVFNSLKSSGAPSTVINDAETINRKIQGKRADNTVQEIKVGEEIKNKISVSQQSFDMQIDHLEKLIELLTIETKYSPNEPSLKIVTLTNYKTELETINSLVKSTYTKYNSALIARDKTLYNPDNGLVATALLVKNYVKSVFGASSPEFKQVNRISFKTR
jgi:hypothetical protein